MIIKVDHNNKVKRQTVELLLLLRWISASVNLNFPTFIASTN